MADYELHISSYKGLVAGAVHYRGRVQGERPRSCHGGTIFHGGGPPELRGKTTCAENHVLPERIEWDVEAIWAEPRYERWAARHFDGPGPAQFTSEAAVIRAAVRRFTGQGEPRWWEEKPVPGQPGDRLYLGYRARNSGEADGRWGTVIAEIPGAPEGSERR